MLANATLALFLSLPGLPEQAEEVHTNVCPWYLSSTTEALAVSLTHVDEACRAQSSGYIEGIYDLGAGVVFNVQHGIRLETMRQWFVIEYQNQTLNPNSFAGAAVVYVLKLRLGEYKPKTGPLREKLNEDAHERQSPEE